MKKEIVVTAILKSGDNFLLVKRSVFEDKYAGMWEFPGGHVEKQEKICDAIKRELKEELNLELNTNFNLIGYSDELDNNVYTLELDFLVYVDKDKIKISLSDEHSEYKWVLKDSPLMDDYIKNKIKNI